MISLFPNLSACAFIMSNGVWRIWILIQNMGVRKLFIESLCNSDERILMITRQFSGGSYNFSSKGSQSVFFLSTHLLRHCNDHPVSSSSSCHCEANSCVPWSGLNDNISWLASTLFFGIKNHSSANPVFDWPSRIQKLTLDKNFTFDSFGFCNIIDPDERGVTNSIKYAVFDLLMLSSNNEDWLTLHACGESL